MPTPAELAGGAAVWGAITGTLADQTDLEARLAAAVPLDGATQMTGSLLLVESTTAAAALSSVFINSADGKITFKDSAGDTYDLTAVGEAVPL